MVETIRINFGTPIPLFPLPETVLLPHAILPLHIFEPRYRQMVQMCLTDSEPMAIGTFAPGKATAHTGDGEACQSIRPAACVGQIIQHDALAGGRYNILLLGVCRATIERVIEPDGDRRYRLARLAPAETLGDEPAALPGVRHRLSRLLERPNLASLRDIDRLRKWAECDEVPTHALLELIGYAVIRDLERKYQLLAESSPLLRARLITEELRGLDRLLAGAIHQDAGGWPKGMSWN